jgi:CBS domain-containing protein
MAQHALARRPPLGFARRFVLARGAHAGTIDLERDVVALFVDAARALAFAHGVLETGTARRLRVGGARAQVPLRDVESWIDAFEFVQALRLRHQCELSERDEPLHDRISPRRLHALDRAFLREALRQVSSLQRCVARACTASVP